MGVDFIKIKADPGAGAQNLSPEVYTAVITRAHELGLPVAAHLFYLDDARGLVTAGVDFLAHSIRDREVDDALVAAMKSAGVYYSPTLMRDVSTYVYESEPAFFADPFFLKAVDAAVLAELRDPERQARIRGNRFLQANKEALQVALVNLKRLADAGVPIVMGTDTGPPRPFPGLLRAQGAGDDGRRRRSHPDAGAAQRHRRRGGGPGSRGRRDA